MKKELALGDGNPGSGNLGQTSLTYPPTGYVIPQTTSNPTPPNFFNQKDEFLF